MPLASNHIDEAFEILDSVRGKPQNPQERKQLSIELAAFMLAEATEPISPEEKNAHEQFSRLMSDPAGRVFTTAMTDQCFRSQNNLRVADQLIYLLNQFGIPKYLPWIKRSQLYTFRFLGASWAQYLVPLVTQTLRKEASQYILPSDLSTLFKRIDKRKSQGIRVNLIRVGEMAHSEAEVNQRLQTYLLDLENPNIEYLCIKISTLYSQINLADFENTIEIVAERLRILYRAAIKNALVLPNGKKQNRMITLDMESYEGIHIMAAAFRKLLEEAEFHHYSAGIALQSYLPDSRQIQKDLTDWAKNRIQNGGTPIHIRIVKGAYLASEQVSASQKNWPQAPYLSKLESDANFKRMVMFGCLSENARAAHLGIGTHNLFDIAYSMLLRSENQVEPYVCFEMLEGVAEPLLHVVNQLTGDVLLYSPIASKEEFLQIIAYLFRRLDENSNADNFLRHAFMLKPGTETWEAQTQIFSTSCDEMDTVLTQPRRYQNRFDHPPKIDPRLSFENDPPTDFALIQNRLWATTLVSKWKNALISPIPLIIGGKAILENQLSQKMDPSDPHRTLYEFTEASHDHLEQALISSKNHEKSWSNTTIEHRYHLLSLAAQKLRERRSDLIGAMMVDASKIISEADGEVCQAVDYAEYYWHQMKRIHLLKDIQWAPIGTILIISPWNFPLANPACGVFAALVTGNCVIFKPSSKSVLVAWNFINALWDAGIPKEVIQFIPCSREIANDKLILDARINKIFFTGSSDTAHQFIKMRPNLNLYAQTSGKNSIIITDMADRELAIKDLISSAFSHNGQKCSSASLAILEANVYDDLNFLNQLKDAAASLKVGPACDFSTQISPLINESRAFKRAITSLEGNEKWLLEPKQDPNNPHLWSPGIKLGVEPNSFTHQTEFFGPILGLMRADSLDHAIKIANGTPFGMTSGLMSLDEREQAYWIEKIEAGNCCINRPISSSVVRRQPLGGTKDSFFGNGSKMGGPNYLREFMKAAQIGLPQEKHPVNDQVNNLTLFLNKIDLTAEQIGIWYTSVANYAYWWKRLRQNRDPNKIIGQDNFFRYLPIKNIVLRIEADSAPHDVLRMIAAALTVEAGFEISYSPHHHAKKTIHWPDLSLHALVIEETADEFHQRVQSGQFNRIRMVEEASFNLKESAAASATHIIDSQPLANGRLELLHYLREISISIEYHRYGNLGLREEELRKPIC